MDSPTKRSTSTAESARPWTSNIVFGFVVVMSMGMIIKEFMIYNSQYWTSTTKDVDEDSTLPTSHVFWEADDASTTTMETTTPPAFKKYQKELGQELGWVWERDLTGEPTGKPTEKPTEKLTEKTIEEHNATSVDASTSNETVLDEIPAFKRHDKVVIATKIHGPHQWLLVDQSMCLLHFAYNHKVLYDIIIFSAEEVPKENIESLEEKIAPAKVKVVKDNIGLKEEIAALPNATYDLFLKRCGVTDPVNLTWWSECREPSLHNKRHRLAYNWQAEFRSVRIWEHPALAEYKYMLWLDSDGFPSREWRKDPVDYFIENKGVIMYDHFGQGSTAKHNYEIIESFNGSTVCDLHLNKEKGHLERKLINKEQLDAANGRKTANVTVPCKDVNVHMVHGFMHITDLDFFRQPKVINGLKNLLGDCFLCRSPDDQLAVTIAPALYAPEKAWDMRSHGYDLKIAHNFAMDGQEKVKPGPGFVKFWDQSGKKDFPTADKVCRITQRDR